MSIWFLQVVSKELPVEKTWKNICRQGAGSGTGPVETSHHRHICAHRHQVAAMGSGPGKWPRIVKPQQIPTDSQILVTPTVQDMGTWYVFQAFKLSSLSFVFCRADLPRVDYQNAWSFWKATAPPLYQVETWRIGEVISWAHSALFGLPVKVRNCGAQSKKTPCSRFQDDIHREIPKWSIHPYERNGWTMDLIPDSHDVKKLKKNSSLL